MVNCARLLHHGSPSAEDNEVWDATHVEPSRQFWIVLRVDLYNDRFPGHIGSRARHLGRRHPAGSAPFSPKVREHRNTGISDDFVERFTINFQGLIHWRQGRFAGTATTGVSEAGRWNAVLSPTGFACSNHRHIFYNYEPAPDRRQAACLDEEVADPIPYLDGASQHQSMIEASSPGFCIDAIS
jgi:hypothetical protein